MQISAHPYCFMPYILLRGRLARTGRIYRKLYSKRKIHAANGLIRGAAAPAGAPQYNPYQPYGQPNIPQGYPQQYQQNIPQGYPQQYQQNIPQGYPQQYQQNVPQGYPQQYQQNIPQSYPQQYQQNVPQGYLSSTDRMFRRATQAVSAEYSAGKYSISLLTGSTTG